MNTKSSLSLVKAINKLTRIDGKLTNTEQGLKMAQQMLHERGCGQKGYHKKLLVLITDGRANRGSTLQGLYDTAKAIRDSGIPILAIGVGDANFTQIQEIAGNKSLAFYHHELNKEFLAKLLTSVSTACIFGGN